MFGVQPGFNTTGSSSNLVEFKAGRMNVFGNMVHADPRKGVVYMTQSEDGLMHFCWKERVTDKVEDDLIVFPNEFEYKRVEQCTTGRVFVLKYKTSTSRMFYWMQEPLTDRDDEYCRRVNDLLNNPPSASREAGSSNHNDLRRLVHNMSREQLLQLLDGVEEMGDLSSVFGSINQNIDSSAGNNLSPLLARENTSTTVPRTSSATKAKPAKTDSSNGDGNSSENDDDANRLLNIDLSTAIAGSNAVNQLITDTEASKLLSVHLPELDVKDETRKQQIKEHIQSPQFQEALTMFTTAFQSAQLGQVVSQFELPAAAVTAVHFGNLEVFFKALDKSLPKRVAMNVGPLQEAIETSTAIEDEDTAKSETQVPKPDENKTED